MNVKNVMNNLFVFSYDFQKFQYSYIYELRNIEDCIDAPHYDAGSKMYLYRCHQMQGNQEFHYTQVHFFFWKLKLSSVLLV